LPPWARRALGDQSGDGEAFVNAREPIGQKFAPVEGGEPIFVAVNHLKSKGSAGPWPGDVDSGDGQGASTESRIRQATALGEWIPTVTDEGDAVALVGDFNSYTQEDPLQVLSDAGYTDAASVLNLGQYSYSYHGLSGSLDHVLLNDAALARATGEDTWEINAEESIALEYSRYNYHGALYYAADPYRSSDHDPVVVGLTTTPGEPTAPAWEATRIYTQGDRVTVDGSTWEALWWTQGQTPGDVWGPWQQIVATADGVAVWTPSRVFTGGDVVEHDGRTWVCQWWSRGQEPQDVPWGPWRSRQ